RDRELGCRGAAFVSHGTTAVRVTGKEALACSCRGSIPVARAKSAVIGWSAYVASTMVLSTPFRVTTTTRSVHEPDCDQPVESHTRWVTLASVAVSERAPYAAPSRTAFWSVTLYENARPSSGTPRMIRRNG